jgi:hypothetical protein
MKTVKLVHSSGTIVEFDAEDVEFYVVPAEDDEGNPNANAGELSGYRIDTGEKMPVFWTQDCRPSTLLPLRTRTKFVREANIEAV